MREIIMDTETTGMSFSEDRVVEIGAVEILDLLPTGRTFHAYINPMRPVSPGAQKVHGLTNEFLKRKPTFRRVAPKFLEFIAGAQLVAHNAPFDLGMLNAELERNGLERLTNPVVDSLALARQVKKGGRHNLDALCTHYKIDNTKRTLHGALLDSEILAEVYLQLRGGRQMGLDLPVEEEDAVEDGDRGYGAREFVSRLTPDEMIDHACFISELGAKSVWASYLNPPADEEPEQARAA
ncbi:DNA polymerase III subunit epsilon [Methylobacterium ajmalii]|uniref:DNA polymerase III subunit epsilon n=1 Tax=Methylobacterium ajmalii TaxID=2738439 RepID=UPI002F360E3F